MKYLLIITAFIYAGTLHAQTPVDSVLGRIERNNTTLKALKQEADAQKLTNRTGIFPTNPEVEFNYLWGSPSSMGHRQDLRITQAVDFPSAYGYRSKISNMQNVQVDMKYKADRLALLLEAKLFCIDLVYYNALRSELLTRLSHAEQLVEAYSRRLESGDGTSIELNRAKLNLATLQTQAERNEIDRNTVASELTRLNGGIAVGTDVAAEPTLLPPSFESWFAEAEQRSPTLQYVGSQVDVNRKQVRLNRALALPSLTAGYMSEKVVGEHFQGLTFGVTVPLWENRNKVKEAKAMVYASESRERDARVQFYERLNNLYQKALGYQKNVSDSRRSLDEFSSTALLKKALDAGEVSLFEYLTELGYYYDVTDQSLISQRDFERACAELMEVEL